MKHFFCISLAAFLVAVISIKAIGQDSVKVKNATMKASSGSLLRHVVLFKFKDGSTPEQIKEVEKAFSALPGKINTIVGYEWGTNISPENLAQGYTHCFLVSFKDAAGRDYYLPHPAHAAFGKVLGPHLDKVLVVDFLSEPLMGVIK